MAHDRDNPWLVMHDNCQPPNYRLYDTIAERPIFETKDPVEIHQLRDAMAWGDKLALAHDPTRTVYLWAIFAPLHWWRLDITNLSYRRAFMNAVQGGATIACNLGSYLYVLSYSMPPGYEEVSPLTDRDCATAVLRWCVRAGVCIQKMKPIPPPT